VTECYFNPHNIYLTTFNQVAHLDHTTRRQYITYA
jgi:hypothetical protein